jgi:hypothetical protein
MRNAYKILVGNPESKRPSDGEKWRKEETNTVRPGFRSHQANSKSNILILFVFVGISYRN